MDVDLFIKKMPLVVKKLIGREAFDNRRSVNQEAIALLEEALVHRVASTAKKRKQVEAILESYAYPRGAAPAGPTDPTVPRAVSNADSEPTTGTRSASVATP